MREVPSNCKVSDCETFGGVLAIGGRLREVVSLLMYCLFL